MQYYPDIKKNEIMPFAATWIQLEIIILSEVNQKEKDIWYHLYVESKIWHKQTHRHREQNCGCQGGGGGMDWEVGISRCKLLIYRMDQQGPTVQHRELYSISSDNP